MLRTHNDTRYAIVAKRRVKGFRFDIAVKEARTAIAAFVASASHPSGVTLGTFLAFSWPPTSQGEATYWPGRLVALADVEALRSALASYDGTARDNLEVVEIRGGDWWVHTHAGPYDGLASAWMDAKNGMDAAGHAKDPQVPPYEIYLNGDQMAEIRPSDLRTEIWLPVEKQ